MGVGSGPLHVRCRRRKKFTFAISSFDEFLSVVRDTGYGNISTCLIQLLILNEYAVRYAVARHYLGLVDVDVFTADSLWAIHQLM